MIITVFARSWKMTVLCAMPSVHHSVPSLRLLSHSMSEAKGAKGQRVGDERGKARRRARRLCERQSIFRMGFLLLSYLHRPPEQQCSARMYYMTTLHTLPKSQDS